MSYIGKEPIVGNFQKCDAITTSSTATYNLTVSSVAVFPETANNCIVSLNGVVQAPTSAYTISGSQIVFASSLTSSDVIDFILILGSVLSVGTPTDRTVTLAKMATGTDGNLITYDASGNPAAVATGSDGQVLTSTGAGSPPVFETPAGGGAWNFIKTQTITSTTANMDFIHGTSDVVFDGTYKYYKVLFRNGTVDTTGAKVYVRVRSGGSFASSGYLAVENNAQYNGSASAISRDATTASIMSTACVYHPGADRAFLGELMFEDPSITATRKSCIFQLMTPFENSSSIRSFVGAGVYSTAGAITGFQFLLSTGSFETLQASLYGLSTS